MNEKLPLNFHFSVFSVIIILASMFVIMIFLVNILIAQLNASYERSAKEATAEYDIAKALFVARLDNSRFRLFVSEFISIFLHHSVRYLINRYLVPTGPVSYVNTDCRLGPLVAFLHKDLQLSLNSSK